jgi:hypothetical protein
MKLALVRCGVEQDNPITIIVRLIKELTSSQCAGYNSTMFTKQLPHIFQRYIKRGFIRLRSKRGSRTCGLAHCHAGCLDTKTRIGQSVA